MKRFTLPTSPRLTSILGWCGALLILLAYVLVSFEFMRPDQLTWQLINLLGSLGIVTAAMPKKDWPAMWLNVIFAAVALLAIAKIIM